jgi:hypothetical protein
MRERPVAPRAINIPAWLRNSGNPSASSNVRLSRAQPIKIRAAGSIGISVGVAMRISPFCVAIVSLWCMASPGVRAQDFRSSLSGGELLEQCQSAIAYLRKNPHLLSPHDAARAAFCAGFVQAAADAGSFIGALPAPQEASNAAFAQRSIRNCAGPTVDGEQLLGTVVQFLHDQPESSTRGAVTVSMLAIAKAFPCP